MAKLLPAPLAHALASPADAATRQPTPRRLTRRTHVSSHRQQRRGQGNNRGGPGWRCPYQRPVEWVGPRKAGFAIIGSFPFFGILSKEALPAQSTSGGQRLRLL